MLSLIIVVLLISNILNVILTVEDGYIYHPQSIPLSSSLSYAAPITLGFCGEMHSFRYQVVASSALLRYPKLLLWPGRMPGAGMAADIVITLQYGVLAINLRFGLSRNIQPSCFRNLYKIVSSMGCVDFRIFWAPTFSV